VRTVKDEKHRYSANFVKRNGSRHKKQRLHLGKECRFFAIIRDRRIFKISKGTGKIQRRADGLGILPNYIIIEISECYL
jgi:hypothetical protein